MNEFELRLLKWQGSNKCSLFIAYTSRKAKLPPYTQPIVYDDESSCHKVAIKPYTTIFITSLNKPDSNL